MVSDMDRVAQDLGRVEIGLGEYGGLVSEIQRIVEIKKERRRIETSYLESKLVMGDWDVLIDADAEYLNVEFGKFNEPETTTKKRPRSPIEIVSTRTDPIVEQKALKRRENRANSRYSRNDDDYPDSKLVRPPKRAPSPDSDDKAKKNTSTDFMTARKLLGDSNPIKRPERPPATEAKRLGSRPAAFIPPLLSNASKKKEVAAEPSLVDDRLKNIDPKMVEQITNEIITISSINWDDIAGLDHAKSVLKETIIWPMLRPDIFTGIRGPTKGLLLFGPPGTGKTLIGKCIASQCKASFFSISSSTLVSKWIGDGEKMVRALFAVARVKQPSVIFVDEIDSMLSQRMEGENDAMRRIKTEFLVQFDGCGTDSNDRILMIGATNRPQEIDEAARRRFRKKLYIPLPDEKGRMALMNRLLSQQNHVLTEEEIALIVKKTEGYSGSDMDGLIRESALGPIRDIVDISSISPDDVRSIEYKDFIEAMDLVKASVSERDLKGYQIFEQEFGSVNKTT